MLAREASHPLVVVRVAELDGWARGAQYAAALAGDYRYVLRTAPRR
jgi:hypothetical protein